MKHVYLAHRLNAATPELIAENRRMARRWVGFLAKHFDVSIHAMWILYSDELEETAVNRELGMRHQLATITMMDSLWMVGPEISSGVRLEATHAFAHRVKVYDLTGVPLHNFSHHPLGDLGHHEHRLAWDLRRWYP